VRVHVISLSRSGSKFLLALLSTAIKDGTKVITPWGKQGLSEFLHANYLTIQPLDLSQPSFAEGHVINFSSQQEHSDNFKYYDVCRCDQDLVLVEAHRCQLSPEIVERRIALLSELDSWVVKTFPATLVRGIEEAATCAAFSAMATLSTKTIILKRSLVDQICSNFISTMVNSYFPSALRRERVRCLQPVKIPPATLSAYLENYESFQDVCAQNPTATVIEFDQLRTDPAGTLTMLELWRPGLQLPKSSFKETFVPYKDLISNYDDIMYAVEAVL